MCLYPRLMKNPKYKEKKCPDKRIEYVPIPCGNCMECRKAKAKEWKIRLSAEINTLKKKTLNEQALFVTLTFSEESLEKIGCEDPNETASIAIKLMLDRWYQKHKKALRHWLVTELGHNGTERIHLHGIIWTDQPIKEIEERWKYGYIWVGKYVNEKTINYIIKYVTKIDQDHPEYKPKIFTSKGIGRKWITEHVKEQYKFKGPETKNFIRRSNGVKTGIPMYFRKKLWTDEEREELWKIKVSQKTRFVNGEKISITDEKGLKEYEKCAEYWRGKSEQYGYGKIEYNIEKYKKTLEKINKT